LRKRIATCIACASIPLVSGAASSEKPAKPYKIAVSAPYGVKFEGKVRGETTLLKPGELVIDGTVTWSLAARVDSEAVLANGSRTLTVPKGTLLRARRLRAAMGR
jgi:hypothetical protein